MQRYSVWSFEHTIHNGGNDAFPDRIAAFARAVLLGDETQIRLKASEIGVRAHPMLLVPRGIRVPTAAASPARRGAPKPIRDLMHMQDRYVCRYCGTRVIDLRVLEALAIASTPYGPVFPKSKNWRFADTHPAFWWQSATIEHKVPVSRTEDGDANDLENLVTACWPCQHRKSNYTLAELGWKLRDVQAGAPAVGSTLEVWDGLVELLEPLKALAEAIAPKKDDPQAAMWKRTNSGAYAARAVEKDPRVYEARNGLWRVKEWPKAPKSRKWELLRRVGEQWESQSFWPSSDLALKIAAGADEKDGIGPAKLSYGPG
jgi:5-methylcytosine-specific restriction endonuclease McrA